MRLHANFLSMYSLAPIPHEIKKSRMTKAMFDHTGYRPIWHWTSISMVEAAPLSALVSRGVYGLGRHLGFREPDGED